MRITPRQHKILESVFPSYNREKSSILMEFGNDNGETFRGDFIVKIFRRGKFRFTDGKLVKKI